MNVVLDTNVLISGLKTRGGTCARVLDLVIKGRMLLCVDDRILDEYERVCGDPRLKLDHTLVRTALDFMRATAEPIVAQPLFSILPDPDDRPFGEVASQATAILITGNRKHDPARVCGNIRVLSPSEFIESIRGSASGPTQ